MESTSPTVGESADLSSPSAGCFETPSRAKSKHRHISPSLTTGTATGGLFYWECRPEAGLVPSPPLGVCGLSRGRSDEGGRQGRHVQGFGGRSSPVQAPLSRPCGARGRGPVSAAGQPEPGAPAPGTDAARGGSATSSPARWPPPPGRPRPPGAAAARAAPAGQPPGFCARWRGPQLRHARHRAPLSGGLPGCGAPLDSWRAAGWPAQQLLAAALAEATGPTHSVGSIL